MSAQPVRTLVLIIGAGAAGLRAAIELRQRGVDCLVVGKRGHGDAHTVMAAGGINAALGSRDPEDDWTIHAADTLREGHHVCDPRAVEILAREAPERVRELGAWGCDFSLTAEGRIDQRYFGAQTYRKDARCPDRESGHRNVSAEPIGPAGVGGTRCLAPRPASPGPSDDQQLHRDPHLRRHHRVPARGERPAGASAAAGGRAGRGLHGDLPRG